MESLRVKADDIAVGQGLPWSMYDSNGRLLLEKGTVIANLGQIESLISRGLYRQKGEAVNQTAGQSKERIEDDSSPFVQLDGIITHLPNLFKMIIDGKNGVEESVIRLCDKLHKLCQEEPDAMLGAVHVVNQYKYTEYHPVHIGILVSIVGASLGYKHDEILPVMAAGLTANVSMIELQEELFKQAVPLTSEQKKAIDEHPANTVSLLVKAGIYNAKWLEVVMMHHEKPDGSGYPNNLKASAISREAQLLSIADRYSAMVSTRAYRAAKCSNEALKEFFMKKSDHCDEEMTLFFIKELGIWPPGTVVELVNGEIAMVTKRGNGSMWPVVSSVCGTNNSVYAHPLSRDCNYEKYRIKEITKLNENMMLNYSMVWGFC